MKPTETVFHIITAHGTFPVVRSSHPNHLPYLIADWYDDDDTNAPDIEAHLKDGTEHGTLRDGTAWVARPVEEEGMVNPFYREPTPENMAALILSIIATSDDLKGCRSFSELHAHCDANTLADLHLQWLSNPTEERLDKANRTQDIVDRELREAIEATKTTIPARGVTTFFGSDQEGCDLKYMSVPEDELTEKLTEFCDEYSEDFCTDDLHLSMLTQMGGALLRGDTKWEGQWDQQLFGFYPATVEEIDIMAQVNGLPRLTPNNRQDIAGRIYSEMIDINNPCVHADEIFERAKAMIVALPLKEWDGVDVDQQAHAIAHHVYPYGDDSLMVDAFDGESAYVRVEVICYHRMNRGLNKAPATTRYMWVPYHAPHEMQRQYLTDHINEAVDQWVEGLQEISTDIVELVSIGQRISSLREFTIARSKF